MTDRNKLIEILDKSFAEQHEKRGLLTAQHTAEHLLANGVICPPCKVGDTVYCLIQGFENPLKATVNRITVQVSGVVISCSVFGYFGQSYMATDFGKTVFLTKSQAEEVLKNEQEKL